LEIREFEAENLEPAREIAPIDAFIPKSLPRSSVMTSSSDLP
jgi:hypothetical protein